jgi:hypothetical protein
MNPEDQILSKKAADYAISKTIQAMKRQGHSFDKLAKELALIAYSDIADYMTVSEGGAIEAVPLKGLSRNKSRAVKKIKEKTIIKESADGSAIYKDSTLEYELYDKMKAIEFSAVLMGMKEPDKHEVTLTNFEDALKAIHEKRGQKS